MANCNYKVILKDIQNKYKFKIFCTGNGNLSNYYTKNETDTLLENKVNTSDLSTVATSGSYNDLSNKPSIPNKTSDLTNDSNFEVNTNKVTSISSSSTDTQYPSAKAVYDSQDAQDTQISNLQEENDYLTSIINQLPKVTGEGTDLTLNNTLNAKLDLDLKGNTYQGGEPTPDTPQDIEVVTGNNTIKVEGKNLCNGINQNVYSNTAVNQCGTNSADSGLYIPVTSNTYTISTKITQARYRVACSKNIPTPVPQTVYRGVNKDGTSNSITIDTTGYDYLIVNATDLTAIQIEKGSTATTYEAYQSASYQVNLGSIELCEIGTDQDRIYKSNGNWYLHKEVDKVVLDGSNDENLDTLETTNGIELRYYNSLIRLNSSQKNLMPIYSDKFIQTTPEYLWNNVLNGIAVANTSNRIILKITDTSINTLELFKNWLSSNNVTIYYILSTPTDTQITDTTLISQLEAIKEATSYSPQTNISQVYADAPFNITASTLLDLSSILNDLETRVSVLETE